MNQSIMDDERTFLTTTTEEDGEERFQYITVGDGMSRMRHTSGLMTEAEAREDLAERGMPQAEIEEKIRAAREKA